MGVIEGFSWIFPADRSVSSRSCQASSCGESPSAPGGPQWRVFEATYQFARRNESVSRLGRAEFLGEECFEVIGKKGYL